MQVELNGRKVGDGCSPYVVAEIGQNHNGDLYTASRMIGEAVKCGVDAVKFQLRNAEKEYTAEVLDSPHPNPLHAYGRTYREHREAIDFAEKDLAHLLQRIVYNEWPVTMFATPTHVSCVEPLERLGMPFYKVASKDLTDLELVNEIGQTGKPVILSTGLADLHDISCALMTLDHDDVIVLQATSQYPCDLENVNLRAMLTIRDEFQVLVGISDHTVGIQVPLMAVTLGACLVEKHFTLARAQPGSDHAGSLEPRGLEYVCRDVRNVAKIMGSSTKDKLPCCNDFARKMQKP